MFGFEAQPPEVGVGNGSAQLMVILNAVESALNVLAKGRRIDVIEQIQAANHVVIFPQGTPGFVFTGKGTEFAHDNMLGRRAL